MSVRKTLIAVSIAGMIATASIAGAQSVRRPPELFGMAVTKADAPLPGYLQNRLREKQAKWVTRISVNKDLLIRGQRELTLNLPDGLPVRIRLGRHYRTTDGTIVWSGADRLTPDGRHSLDGGRAPTTAMFVVRGDRVAGEIVLPNGQIYEVQTSEDGAQKFMVQPNRAFAMEDDEVDHAGVPAQPDLSRIEQEKPRTRAKAVTTSTTINVLLVWTPEAVNEVGGQQAAYDRSAVHIANSNTVFANNGLAIRFATGARQVAFAAGGQGQTNSCATLKDRMIDKTDGWWDEYATTVRDSTKSDIVALITREGLTSSTGGSIGGCARLKAVAADAFLVMEQDGTANLALVHEAGHLFGAAHQTAITTNNYYTWGHGYINTTGDFRTVMVNDSAYTRISYFSTPDQKYTVNGVARTLGNSETANNERVMRDRASAVSFFR